MIVIVPPNPMPNCRRCKRPMDFYVLGMPLKDHIHDECWIEEFGEEVRAILRRSIRRAFEEVYS